jgi:hypothetical protein
MPLQATCGVLFPDKYQAHKEGVLCNMAKGRDNAAENLIDVLEFVRIRRQSGLLSVEHEQDGRMEEGEIYFLGGQPTYARTGLLSGQQALSQILSWRKVLFTFITDVLRPSATNLFPVAEGDPNSGAAPAYVSPALSLRPSVPPASTEPTVPVGSNRSGLPGRPRENEPAYVGSAVRTSTVQGAGSFVPQRRGGDEDILSLPLTRRQRSIYLLVDGRRTISDLSRCTGKSVQEVERMLSELREQGLLSV